MVKFESLVNSEGSKTKTCAGPTKVSLRALLIQKEAKPFRSYNSTFSSLRALLIQKEAKHHYNSTMRNSSLRALLIQKEAKPLKDFYARLQV